MDFHSCSVEVLFETDEPRLAVDSFLQKNCTKCWFGASCSQLHHYTTSVDDLFLLTSGSLQPCDCSDFTNGSSQSHFERTNLSTSGNTFPSCTVESEDAQSACDDEQLNDFRSCEEEEALIAKWKNLLTSDGQSDSAGLILRLGRLMLDCESSLLLPDDVMCRRMSRCRPSRCAALHQTRKRMPRTRFMRHSLTEFAGFPCHFKSESSVLSDKRRFHSNEASYISTDLNLPKSRNSGKSTTEETANNSVAEGNAQSPLQLNDKGSAKMSYVMSCDAANVIIPADFSALRGGTDGSVACHKALGLGRCLQEAAHGQVIRFMLFQAHSIVSC